ncbi:hypothetical protein Tco_0520428, partial [Tanacetum coccineum]
MGQIPESFPTKVLKGYNQYKKMFLQEGVPSFEYTLQFSAIFKLPWILSFTHKKKEAEEAVVGDLLKGLGEGGNPCSLANTEYVGLVIGLVLGDEGDGNLGKIKGVGALGFGKTTVFLSELIPVKILLIRNL